MVPGWRTSFGLEEGSKFEAGKGVASSLGTENLGPEGFKTVQIPGDSRCGRSTRITLHFTGALGRCEVFSPAPTA